MAQTHEHNTNGGLEKLTRFQPLDVTSSTSGTPVTTICTQIASIIPGGYYGQVAIKLRNGKKLAAMSDAYGEMTVSLTRCSVLENAKHRYNWQLIYSLVQFR